MPAQPNPGGNVYHRDAPEDIFQAWNAVIRKVNEERQNPPEDTDCEPLDAIEEVEEDHVWTKMDVENIRAAIDEMCPYAWTEPLDFWHRRVLDEINEALSREYGGWGNEADGCCEEEEECVPDCSNASNTIEELYMGSYELGFYNCIGNPPPNDDCSLSRRLAVASKGGEAFSKMMDGADAYREYCALVAACEELEHELEILQEQLEALEVIRDTECAKPPPNNCAAAQAAVDAKQQEVDDKQEELNEKEAERDAKLAESQAYDAESDALAAESMALMDAVCTESCYPISSWVFPIPWVDTDCEQLGPDCLGYGPDRCRCGWSLTRKVTYHFWGGYEYEGGWEGEAIGWYTRSGQPLCVDVRACGGRAKYTCASYGPNPCSLTPPCNPASTHEWKLNISHPPQNPTGEECCD